MSTPSSRSVSPRPASSTLRFDTVSFLSDLGIADEFVGLVHSVVRSTAPGVTVIDLSHAIARHDVRAEGLLLARAAQYLCAGVVIAAVDPGAGTDRRAIAVEVGGGASVLLGPDNGVLAPAVAMVGGADRAVVLNNVEYHLPSVGAGCTARRFRPVAGHLCLGVPLEALGDAVDTVSLRPATVALTRVEDEVLQAQVLWVDHFGNAQLNVDPDEIADYGDLVEVAVGNVRRAARRWVRTSSWARARWVCWWTATGWFRWCSTAPLPRRNCGSMRAPGSPWVRYPMMVRWA